MRVSSHSRSLKMVSFESLRMLSYSPSIVTMVVSLAISQISSIKEWPDLEIWVWCRQRSFKMPRFDRPCTTFCWSAIVTIAPSWSYSYNGGPTASILYHVRVMWRWIISWPWNLAQRSLKIIETGAIRKLGCGFLFAFYSIYGRNYGRICSRLWAIQRQSIWPWKLG